MRRMARTGLAVVAATAALAAAPQALGATFVVNTTADDVIGKGKRHRLAFGVVEPQISQIVARDTAQHFGG